MLMRRKFGNVITEKFCEILTNLRLYDQNSGYDELDNVLWTEFHIYWICKNLKCFHYYQDYEPYFTDEVNCIET